MDSQLKFIADNPSIFAALKEALLAQCTLEGTVHLNLENEAIGQIIRARLDARNIIEKTFIEILKHRTAEDIPPEIMKGR